tara:strand:- start:122 stop:301 length:180 start_codon:yes stop_codon:yes gene_type:complete
MVLHGQALDKRPSIHLAIQRLEAFDDLKHNRFTFFAEITRLSRETVIAGPGVPYQEDAK